MPEPKPDQKDILAQIETLTAELTASRASLVTASASIATLTSERDAARTALAAVTGERDSVKTALASITGERDTLKAENQKLISDKLVFEAAVAAKVATLGIVQKPDTKSDASPNGKPLTITERILKAKGVSSLAELEAKRVHD